MNKIIPAVIPESLEHLTATLETFSTFAQEIQIDIVDGKFVPFTSWPYTEKGSIKDLASLIENFVVEVDCMIDCPEEVIADYAKAGAKRIVVHLESALNLPEIIKLKTAHGFELGFSINNDTDLHALTSVLNAADYVQFMGIKDIGSQGQPFDERVLTRIKELKDINPAIFISIDGSVTLETLPRLREAGADRFVAGSSILKAEDPKGAFKELQAI